MLKMLSKTGDAVRPKGKQGREQKNVKFGCKNVEQLLKKRFV
jgi:hypothetical protein